MQIKINRIFLHNLKNLAIEYRNNGFVADMDDEKHSQESLMWLFREPDIQLITWPSRA